jgi:hypothetical protein
LATDLGDHDYHWSWVTPHREKDHTLPTCSERYQGREGFGKKKVINICENMLDKNIYYGLNANGLKQNK